MESDKPETEQPPIVSNTEVVPEAVPVPESEYKPKDLVLAKVKGYPPWPAMVLEEALLPENIKIKKPKSVKQKKNSKIITALPVRFFSDDTYIWIKDSDVVKLTQSSISKYLSDESNAKRRKDNLLKLAYELANNPPEMDIFIKWGSKGEPEPIPEPEPEVEAKQESAEEDVAEEPPTKKQKVTKKTTTATKAKSTSKAKTTSKATTTKAKAADKKAADKKAADKKAADKKAADKKAADKKAADKKAADKKAADKKVADKKAADKLKAQATDPYEGYDSDWGLERDEHVDDKVYGNTKEQKEFENNFPTSQEVNENFQKSTLQIEKIRDNLSRLLLIEETVNEGDILKELKKLNSSNFAVSLIKSSQVNKILIAVSRRPVEKFDHSSIRKEISKLLLKWFDFEVLPNESKEGESTTAPASARASEAPTAEIKGEPTSNGA